MRHVKPACLPTCAFTYDAKIDAPARISTQRTLLQTVMLSKLAAARYTSCQRCRRQCQSGGIMMGGVQGMEAAAQMMKPGDGKLSRYVLRAYGSRQQREKTSSEKTRNAELQTGGGADSLPQSEPPAPSDSKRLMGAQPKSDTRMLCDLRTTRECCVHVRANQRTTGEQSAQPKYASDALAATNQQASKRLSPTI